jgi:hypothetical protein
MTRTIAGLLLGFMLMASGCSDKESVPKDVLSHDKMEAVMWDVIEAEQYAGNYLVKDTPRLDLKMESLRMYDEIFRLHQTSREQFRKSYAYYMGRADLAQALFDSLQNKGNKLRSESYSRPSRTVTLPPAPMKGPLAKPGTTVTPGSTGTSGSTAKPASEGKSGSTGTTVKPGSAGTTVKPGSAGTNGSMVKPAPGLTPAAALRDSLLKKRFPLLSPKQRDSLIKRRKLPS